MHQVVKDFEVEKALWELLTEKIDNLHDIYMARLQQTQPTMKCRTRAGSGGETAQLQDKRQETRRVLKGNAPNRAGVKLAQ
jgi:hypothetical protein